MPDSPTPAMLVDRLDPTLVSTDKLEGTCPAPEVCIMVVVVVVEPLELCVPTPTTLTAIGTLVAGLGAKGDTTLVVTMDGKFFICSAKAFMLEIPLKTNVKIFKSI